MKEEKDNNRINEASENSPFNSRGYSIDSRTQLVEMSQLEDAQALEVDKHNLDHLQDRNRLILEERAQETNLAQIICPDYDPFNDHWKRVAELTFELNELKNVIVSAQVNGNEVNKNRTGSNMAGKLLASVNKKQSTAKYSTVDSSVLSKDSNSMLSSHKRAIDDTIEESPSKKLLVVDDEHSSSISEFEDSNTEGNAGSRKHASPVESTKIVS